jgi:hypothetical protein
VQSVGDGGKRSPLPARHPPLATRHSMKKRTLTDHNHCGGNRPSAASRDAAGDAGLRQPARRALVDGNPASRPDVAKRRPDRRGQAPKGAGGMPRRHQNSGVEGCEMSGGAAQRASIPEYPSNPGN